MPLLINRKTNRTYHISKQEFDKLPGNVIKAFIVKQVEEPEAVKALRVKLAIQSEGIEAPSDVKI